MLMKTELIVFYVNTKIVCKLMQPFKQAQLMLRNLRDAISSGGRKSNGNWLVAVSYAEGVLTYWQAARFI